MEFPIRINKYLATRGFAARREADALIAAGKVTVNGKRAVLGQQIIANDVVEVKNHTTKSKRYLAYYKPRGILTHSAVASERDILSEIKSLYKITDIYPIGRLDKDSEGLILLTDDGRITGPLLDPAAQHEKEYEVLVDKPINNWFLRHMAAGVEIEGYRTKPAKITAHKNPQRFNLILTEGKKHQIRRMCAALGYQVQSLKRIRIMHITLDNLKPGQYRKLTSATQNKLLKTLGVPTS